MAIALFSIHHIIIYSRATHGEGREKKLLYSSTSSSSSSPGAPTLFPFILSPPPPSFYIFPMHILAALHRGGPIDQQMPSQSVYEEEGVI
jgi:hypothetical protein